MKTAVGACLLVVALGCDRKPEPAAEKKAPLTEKGSAEKTPDEGVPEAAVERARAALLPLKTNLKQALVSALNEKGAVGALEVCHTAAPKLHAEASVGGLKVGRTSTKLRNPANAPPDWTKPYLTELANAKPDAWRAKKLSDGGVGYAEPIRVGGLCLTCHGASVDAEVKAKIEALYPNDQATGYQAGDFRGLFWVELPAEG